MKKIVVVQKEILQSLQVRYFFLCKFRTLDPFLSFFVKCLTIRNWVYENFALSCLGLWNFEKFSVASVTATLHF